MSNQYLVYAALLLGSVGAYGTLNPKGVGEEDSSSVNEFLSEALTKGDVSPQDLTKILSEVTQEQSRFLKRIQDLESSADTMDLNLTKMDGKVEENLRDLAFITPDFQEQISTNKSEADRYGTTADTNLSTIDEIIQPELESLRGDLTSLEESGVSLGTRIGIIETARQTESVERSTLSADIIAVAEDVTTNLGFINAIEDDLINVYDDQIKSNKDNIAAVVDDLAFLTDKIVRDPENDEIVCHSKFITKAGALLSLNGDALRLGNSQDSTWTVSKGASASFAMAAKMSVSKNASHAFVVDNNAGEELFSVKGLDGRTQIKGTTQVAGNLVLFNSGGNAVFSHIDHYKTPGLTHKANGDVVVRAKKAFAFLTNGNNMIFANQNAVTLYKQLNIKTDDGETMYDSHFNYNGDNYFSAKYETNFRFARNSKSIVMRHGEIHIKGPNDAKYTEVLAELKKLRADITTIQNDSTYIKTDGTWYHINGHKTFDGKGSELGYDGGDARWHPNNTRMKCKFYKAT